MIHYQVKSGLLRLMNVCATLGLQLFAGTNFSEFHNSVIWRVLILADL